MNDTEILIENHDLTENMGTASIPQKDVTLELIRHALQGTDSIHGWKINVKETESIELFFIKKSLDMNRRKNVTHYMVTVFKDFEKDGILWRGSSSANIAPSMNQDEVSEIIQDLALAASFVKNKHYDLNKPETDLPDKADSAFEKGDLSEWIPKLIESLFKGDIYSEGCLNSSEIFVNRSKNHIINSEGIDVVFDDYSGLIEIVAEWDGVKESVELFRIFKFSDMCPEKIEDEVRQLLNECKEKAIAIPAPAMKNINVLLSGEAVGQLLDFYVGQSNAQMVYEGISTIKIGENIQGDSVDGDWISLTLEPTLKNSSSSSPYDTDGVTLKRTMIFDKGVLQTYHGSQRYSSYLDIEPTGIIKNASFAPGKFSEEVFRSEPYVELISFSAFDMDPITGDFGGEVRLARTFDGTKTTALTGASVSLNLKECHKNMYLSKEIKQDDSYQGPRSILFKNASIAGVEV